MTRRRGSGAAKAAALAMALWGLGSPAEAADVPGPIDVEAGEVSYDQQSGRYLLSGGAVLRRGTLTVRCRDASYDPGTGEVAALGDVLLLEPGRALAASSAHLIIDGPFAAQDVTAFLKPGTLDLSSARTISEARDKGL